MTFHQLNLFRHVVDFGSITRASSHLGIPQPAVTRAVRSLEQELGVSLLDRTGRGIRVNENGRLLYDYARQVLRLTASLETAMTERKVREETTVSILVEAASHLFPSICTAFAQKFSDAKFRALHQDAPDEADLPDYPLRLYSSREGPDRTGSLVLAEEEILLAVQPDGPFGQRDRIALAEVSGMGFVSLFKTRGLRRITDYYCQLAGFEPQVIFETDNTSTVMRYVSSGHGIAFIPAMTWPREREDGTRVHLLSITEPLCRRFIKLAVADGRLNPYEKHFRDFLVDYFLEQASRDGQDEGGRLSPDTRSKA
jgi:LysR family transcriptional activator of glutamate synthase operon